MASPLTSRQSAGEKLRGIQSLTDAALSRLDAEDLLAELLDRVKAVLPADTAAVLLLDRSSGHLVATAASGLEEEVRQGVRIPVGRGFAGRVAAEGRPVIIDHVDHTNVINPSLVNKGLRSLIGVPLIADGSVIGVLHAGSLNTRRFTQEDVGLLQLAAERAAMAAQSVTARADRAAATALQRSLTPAVLPGIPGVEMAGRYVPGKAVVGGDWYDVFTLPSGELCVAVGDVAGAGLRAAVVMGRMRSALRAYALETADPADVLARLDRKMQHFEVEPMATVIYAVFDPSLERVHISSAGHFPPVILAPGEAGALAEVESDLLIGVTQDVSRRVTTLPVPPGTLLCFFTDGLVERKDRPLDDSLARLCDTLIAAPPQQACASVMGAMIGGEQGRDDIALLIVQRLPADGAAGAGR